MSPQNNWLNIALYKPLIPQNTGNIGRTCVGLNIALHIIGTPGFHLENKYLKRAGLDYWKNVNLNLLKDFDSLYKKHENSNFYYFTKNGKKSIFDITFSQGDFLIFGQETEGLPDKITEKNVNNTVFLPMEKSIRSFNLSNVAAIAAFEAYRQLYHKKINIGPDA